MKKEHLQIYVKYYFFSLVVVSVMATIQLKYILGLPLGIKSYAVPAIASLFLGLLSGRIYFLKEVVSKAAFTDPLTGLSNRRSIHERLVEVFALAKRYQNVFSLIILDIDNFKRINDCHGHLLGDQVLKEIGETLKSWCRESDYCARWGGEEFLVLLSNTGLDGATKMAEKVRQIMEKRNFTEVGRVTCSFGVAEYTEGISSYNKVLDQADLALYKAKNQGKNRVEAFSGD